MYIVEANEQGITELEEIYSRAPLIFPSASDNLALFVRALSPKRIDARFARNNLPLLNLWQILVNVVKLGLQVIVLFLILDMQKEI